MFKSLLCIGGVLWFAVSSARPQEVSPQATEKMGPVAKAMLVPVENGELAGAVILVAEHGKVLEFSAFGSADIAGGRRMETGDLFWVASMTKTVTALAIMILVDEGKVKLDDPVEKYLPAFKHPWMVAEITDTRTVLTRRPHSPTIRQLIDHTHALTEVPTPAAYTPLEEWVDEAARAPLTHEPGTKWTYGNVGNSVLGRVIEVVAGLPYQDFLRQRIFDPLGMKDTTLFPNISQVARLAKSYKSAHGKPGLEETSIGLIKGDITSDRRTVFPGGGLFSTAEEMGRLYQLLADGGRYEGKQVLSRQSVEEMTRNQVGDLPAGFSAGMSWGLGVGIVREPTGWTDVLPIGVYGHDGAFGNTVIVDPARDLVMIMMIQRAELDPYKDGLRFRKMFQAAVYQTYGDNPAK